MSVYVFTGGVGPTPEEAAPALAAVGPPRYVIAADAGLLAAERFGYRPNKILGDFDSLNQVEIAMGRPDHKALGDFDSLDNAAHRLAAYPAAVIERHPTDKDATDTELALAHAVTERREGEALVLIGGGGGRTDHLLAIIRLCGGPLAPDLWLPGEQAAHVLRAPQMLHAQGVPAGDAVSLFPLGSGPHRCLAEGLRWPVAPLDWAAQYSLSNEAAPPGSVTVWVEAGAFLLFLPLVAQGEGPKAFLKVPGFAE
jgi:thiamine pyrophosphokinase